MIEDVHKLEEPIDRLTRLCNAMVTRFDNDPEHQTGDRAVIFLMDDHRGGMVIHGYTDEADAIADIFIHLKALFQANGKDLAVITLPQRGVG